MNFWFGNPRFITTWCYYQCSLVGRKRKNYILDIFVPFFSNFEQRTWLVPNISKMCTFINVGLSVGEPRSLPRLLSKHPPEIRSLHVVASFFHGVTLGAFLHKHLLPFLDVPHGQGLEEEEMTARDTISHTAAQTCLEAGRKTQFSQNVWTR